MINIDLSELQKQIDRLRTEGHERLPEPIFFFESGTPIDEVQSWITATLSDDKVQYQGSAERVKQKRQLGVIK